MSKPLRANASPPGRQLVAGRNRRARNAVSYDDRMGAETVGMHMPAVVTLDDLAAMNASDQNGHRYETSPEGVLSVMPPADSEHAQIASRLLAWLIMAGWPAQQVLQVAGIRVPGSRRDGGRIPDVSVWGKAPPRGVWLPVAELLLVIEIVSPGSEAMDEVTKRREYASAGIPQYWVVDRDDAQTVTLYQLSGADTYAEHAKMPLVWLLQTDPADHFG
ncbi:Uma2 family endonuclease [Actinoplanes sp. NPDC026619]|uniref:Uma2 family endonuclease n=1 Tax=Actinoplanes sp. NPDC026619 TaxID=3155798 RepID=UPI0033C3FB65